MQIFTGLEKSPCATPCRTFHTKTKFLSSVKEKTDNSLRVKLFFVLITITEFVKPTTSSDAFRGRHLYLMSMRNKLHPTKVHGVWQCGLAEVSIRRSSFFSKYIFL